MILFYQRKKDLSIYLLLCDPQPEVGPSFAGPLLRYGQNNVRPLRNMANINEVGPFPKVRPLRNKEKKTHKRVFFQILFFSFFLNYLFLSCFFLWFFFFFLNYFFLSGFFNLGFLSNNINLPVS